MTRRTPMVALVTPLLFAALPARFAATDLSFPSARSVRGATSNVVLAALQAAPRRRRAVRNLTARPIAAADSYTVGQAATLTIGAPGVLGNDTLNGATIQSYGATTGAEQTTLGSVTPTAQNGTIALNAGGSFTYDPASSFAGTDTFEYVLTNASGSSTATVTLTVVPLLVALPDTYSTPRNMLLSVPAPGVLANDILSGGSIASYGAPTGSEQTSIGSPTPTLQGGTVTLSANGDFTYNPLSGFTGSDTFKYVIQNAAGSSTAAVTIGVQAPAGGEFSVTSPGFFYSFAGLSGQNPQLTLVRGGTYTFKISTDSIHPFEILNAPPGSVINNNISSGTITFNVPAAAANYRYHCSIHNFGNTIITVNP
jgi:hypothetical protein